MKKCSTCQIKKDLIFFSKNSYNTDSFSHHCKSCVKSHREKRKEQISLYNKKYRQLHKEALYQKRKVYLKNNPEKVKKWKSDFRIKNPEACAEYGRKTYQKNKKKRLAENNEYNKKRSLIDPSFKLSRNLRNRLYHALKGKNKNGSSIKDLGCSVQELKIYIESKFQQGMTWDNYGYYGWHVDHIIPLIYFDLTDRDQLLKACHYTNLQPMWAVDHKTKTKKDIREKGKNTP